MPSLLCMRQGEGIQKSCRVLSLPFSFDRSIISIFRHDTCKEIFNVSDFLFSNISPICSTQVKQKANKTVIS